MLQENTQGWDGVRCWYPEFDSFPMTACPEVLFLFYHINLQAISIFVSRSTSCLTFVHVY